MVKLLESIQEAVMVLWPWLIRASFMNLQQLRYLCEVVRCRLNISRAASSLGTSQPAVSQQIRMLEEELGTTIFLRSRNRLSGLTPTGESLVGAAQQVLAEMANLQNIARESRKANAGEMRVVSTHAQARYALPHVIREFRSRYPGIDVHVTHKQDEKMWELVQNGYVDLAITTDVRGLPKGLLALPCYPMQRSLIAPRRHPLLRVPAITLKEIAGYPLIAFNERSHGLRRLMRAFAALGYTPKVVVSAPDEDVIKAYVEEGLGVAILASIVYDPKRDTRLGAVDVTPLLEPSTTSVVVRKSMAYHEHIAAFIVAFAPEWTRECLNRELKR